MTEDDAKTKVCCGPRNGAHQDDDIFCKASICMAWRWEDNDPCDSCDIERNYHRKHGYCGLAGGHP